MHDEEPADDELEFSDDEAEAAYKSSLKRKYANHALLEKLH
jgi:H/ACA ribonucleoprotein complex non-core subunit NAF1